MTQALMLMDIQNGVVKRFGATDAYLDRVVVVQARAEAASIPMILVRVGFSAGHPEVSPRNAVFGPIRDSGGMLLDGHECEPHARLHRGKGEIVVTKKRISAFAGSDLSQVLRAHDVEHLVLAGIATSGVVLSTVREAADLDYGITVLADLCLDADDEVHRVLTEKIFPLQATVIDSAHWTPS